MIRKRNYFKKRRNRKKKADTDDIESKSDNDDDILNSNFPEPIFVDDGFLATDGNTYHQKALVEGEDIKINDSILVLTRDFGEKEPTTYCGLILKMWSTPENELCAEVNWYWKRFEMPEELQEYTLKRELFLSEMTQIIPLDSIKHKVTIFDSPDPIVGKVNTEPHSMTDAFFCNRGFFYQRMQFVALSTIRRLLKLAENEGIEPVEGKTVYDMCISRLQLSRTNMIYGREKEMDEIKRYLQSMLMKNGNGACLYVSGVPGTGKTLCVRETIRQLANDAINGKIDDFEYYEINCMSLDETPKIYSEMWYQLVGEKLPHREAIRYLNHLFTSDPPDKYIVLLIDEIDVLLTPKQLELYCILEWANLPKSHIILICIANLMDLNSRISPKMQSRLGKAAVHFYTYKAPELQEIINQRIGKYNIFHSAAIQYCCKTVANFGGDARKALGICKRSIEIFLNSQKDSPKGQIKLVHVAEAAKEMQNTRATNILNKLSEIQKYFLVAFLNDSKITRRIYIPARDVISRTRTILKQTRSKIPFNQQIFLIAGKQLVEMGILETQNGKLMDASSLILLKCIEHDAVLAMNKTEKFKRFLEIAPPT